MTDVFGIVLTIDLCQNRFLESFNVWHKSSTSNNPAIKPPICAHQAIPLASAAATSESDNAPERNCCIIQIPIKKNAGISKNCKIKKIGRMVNTLALG